MEDVRGIFAEIDGGDYGDILSGGILNQMEGSPSVHVFSSPASK